MKDKIKLIPFEEYVTVEVTRTKKPSRIITTEALDLGSTENWAMSVKALIVGTGVKQVEVDQYVLLSNHHTPHELTLVYKDDEKKIIHCLIHRSDIIGIDLRELKDKWMQE